MYTRVRRLECMQSIQVFRLEPLLIYSILLFSSHETFLGLIYIDDNAIIIQIKLPNDR